MGDVIPQVSRFKYLRPILQNDGKINLRMGHTQDRSRMAKMKKGVRD